MPDSDAVTITLRDVYNLVVELKETITRDYSPLPEIVADHEKRIRVLESPPRMSGWSIAGVIVAAVVGLVGILGFLVTLMRYIPDVP